MCSSGVQGGSVKCFLVLVFLFFTLLVQRRLSFTFRRVALIAQCSVFSLPLLHTVTTLSVHSVEGHVLLLNSTLCFPGLQM